MNGRVDELTKSLAEYRGLHIKAVKRLDQALDEKSNLKEELDGIRNSGRQYVTENEIVSRIDNHQTVVVKAVEELRNDVAAVRDTLAVTTATDKAIESAGLSELREDLINIQNTLNDAVAELTLEADALIQSRDAIQTAASGVSREGQGKASFLEQQERLLTEFKELRENVNKAIESKESAANNNGGALSRKLVADLQRKEAALATAQTELKFLKEKLESEIAARQAVDLEVVTLNEQADAYEEEIMTLRSANTKLIKKLRTAGMKIDAALLAGRMPSMSDDLSTIATPRSSSMKGDEPFAVLDEALALATGLTDIVNNGKRESTAMEMLESMQEMFDVSETKSSTPVASLRNSMSPRRRNQKAPGAGSPTAFSPRHRTRKVYDAETGDIEIIHETVTGVSGASSDEAEPSPVDTPYLVNLPSQEPASNESALQLIVEQLYGRCELLERERIEMMEATLDLLESARDASTAELEAALATARRRATDEMVRTREQNYQDQERIFHRLCTQCIRSRGRPSDTDSSSKKISY